MYIDCMPALLRKAFSDAFHMPEASLQGHDSPRCHKGFRNLLGLSPSGLTGRASSNPCDFPMQLGDMVSAVDVPTSKWHLDRGTRLHLAPSDAAIATHVPQCVRINASCSPKTVDDDDTGRPELSAPWHGLLHAHGADKIRF